MHGCNEERADGPREIGPFSLPRCPNWYLKRHDPLRDEAIKVYQDYKAGALRDWPDGYSGAVASAVRMIDREINTCEAEIMKAHTNEVNRQSQTRRSR